MIIYLYDCNENEIYSLDELTDTEFVKVAEQFCKEGDLRVWRMLPPFKAKKPNILGKIRCKLLFRKGGITNV